MSRAKGKGNKGNRLTKANLAKADEAHDSDYDGVDSPALGSEVSDFEHVSDWSEKLKELTEALTEKRATARIASINKLAKALRQHFLKDEVQSIEVSLTMYLLSSIRKGGPLEVVAACDVLGLVCLTLGADAEKLFNEASEGLTVLAKDPKKPAKSRAACLHTLALLTFIGCNERAYTLMVMALCHTIYMAPVTTIAAADEEEDEEKSSGVDADTVQLTTEALLAWGLLASSLSPMMLLTPSLPEMLKELGVLLDGGSVESRTAAGENLALIYSALLSLEESDTLPDLEEAVEEEDGKEESAAHTTAASYVAAALNISDLVDKLQELSTDSSHRKTKKDKRQQRSAFREIVRTVTEGDEPEETLQIGTYKHSIEGWGAMRQLDFLRRTLGSGLLHHFSQNDLLGEILGIDAAAGVDVNMTSQQKKSIRKDVISVSKQKARAQQEKNQRNRKIKQAHLQEDD